VRTAVRLLREPGGVFGVIVVGALVLVALLAPLLARADPYEIGADFPLAPPSAAHVFGTDDLGRDVFARVVFGARISLVVSLGSALGALVLALPLGLIAGYLGGSADLLISRLFDTIFAFPAILLGIGLVTVLGSSVFNVILAVAIISVPTLGRLTRIATLTQRGEEYAEAARSVGAPHVRVVGRHILPNILPPLLVQITLVMAEAVLLEAAFSFLGLGIRPPAPSWGTMLNAARSFLAQAPWLGLFPGLAITVMILGLNALGDALRVALNPRQQ
jgi:ABC-type dipeptide/oligopeptide/nickel transport system permease subunit